jgi:hypothetical protein
LSRQNYFAAIGWKAFGEGGFHSGLLETDAIALHCDERYQPCGWTAPLARVVDLKTFQNQTATLPW